MQDLELLIKLVEQNSYTYNKAGVDAVGNLIKAELSFMNIQEFQHEKVGDMILFSSPKTDTTKPKILLCGHSDTVHKEEDSFPVERKGNKLFGPGTQDMKSGLVTIIQILQNLYKIQKLENVDFLLVPDEEAQSIHFRKKMDQLYKKYDIGLVFEASTSNIDGEKYSPKSRSVVTGRKGAGVVNVKITGPGGHSGVLDKREDRMNAIEEAAHIILKVEEIADYKKRTTLNIGIIKGGSYSNVISTDCEIILDYRTVTKKEEKRVLSELKKLEQQTQFKKTKIEVTKISSKPPMEETTKSIELLEKLKAIAKQQGIKIKKELRGGASDGNEMSVTGMVVLDALGPQGDGEHSRDEFVYIDSIAPSIELNLNFLKTLLDIS